MKVSIVCVNYNSYKQLEKYLNSLQTAYEKCKNLILEVYIADNSSLKQELSFNYSFVCVSVPLDNLGYFGGAFEVINSNEIIRESDYIVISNVDLQIAEDFFIELQNVKVDKNTAWIAPQIWSNYEKRDKNPQRIDRCSKSKLKLLYFLYSFPFLQQLYSKIIYPIRKNKRINQNKFEHKKIYCGHGSFIILTKQFVKMNPTLNYPCFLFCEELFLGETIKNSGFDVIYEPSLKIIDDEHVSTGKLPSQNYYKYNRTSLLWILQTFYK